MRKAIHQLRRTVRDLFFAAAFLTALAIVYTLSQIPTQYYYAFAVAAFIGLCLWRLITSKFSNTYIDKDGYVILKKENEREHRYIAKKILGRDLKHNEVVHHINGKRADNKIENLCVMDRQKHEMIHVWLTWKRKKDGKYPHPNYQKKVLVGRSYGGILLENAIQETKPIPQKHQRFIIDTHKKTNAFPEKNNCAVSKKLFDDLRRERRIIAHEKEVALYEVFHNSTLQEMIKHLPETKEAMIKINGVGEKKFHLYGAPFLAVIKSFKNAKSKDSA